MRLKRDFGTYPNSVEGRRQGEWILIDYVDFIVHIFSAENAPSTVSSACANPPPPSASPTSTPKSKPALQPRAPKLLKRPPRRRPLQRKQPLPKKQPQKRPPQKRHRSPPQSPQPKKLPPKNPQQKNPPKNPHPQKNSPSLAVPHNRVPHVRDSLIVANVGNISSSTHPIPPRTLNAGCPTHRAFVSCDEWAFAERTALLSQPQKLGCPTNGTFRQTKCYPQPQPMSDEQKQALLRRQPRSPAATTSPTSPSTSSTSTRPSTPARTTTSSSPKKTATQLQPPRSPPSKTPGSGTIEAAPQLRRSHRTRRPRSRRHARLPNPPRRLRACSAMMEH